MRRWSYWLRSSRLLVDENRRASVYQVRVKWIARAVIVAIFIIVHFAAAIFLHAGEKTVSEGSVSGLTGARCVI